MTTTRIPAAEITGPLGAVIGFAARRMLGHVPDAHGLRVEIDGQLAAAVSVAIEDGRITRIYSVANPDKLARLDAEAALAR